MNIMKVPHYTYNSNRFRINRLCKHWKTIKIRQPYSARNKNRKREENNVIEYKSRRSL